MLCSPRADRHTDGQTQKWIQRTPFQGFWNVFFNLSSRIGPIKFYILAFHISLPSNVYKPQKLLSIDLDAVLPIQPGGLPHVVPREAEVMGIEQDLPVGHVPLQDRSTVVPVIAFLGTGLVVLFLFNQYYRTRSRPRRKRPRPRKLQQMISGRPMPGVWHAEKITLWDPHRNIANMWQGQHYFGIENWKSICQGLSKVPGMNLNICFYWSILCYGWTSPKKWNVLMQLYSQVTISCHGIGLIDKDFGGIGIHSLPPLHPAVIILLIFPQTCLCLCVLIYDLLHDITCLYSAYLFRWPLYGLFSLFFSSYEHLNRRVSRFLENAHLLPPKTRMFTVTLKSARFDESNVLG